MRKMNVSRRRGTTIAAAALSVAMVSPFVHAVAPASPFVSVANAQQDAPAADAPADASKAIYSPGQASQKGTISGSVKEVVEALIGFGNVQGSGRPISGVKVYAQWYEGRKSEHTSPVYYTESDANGNFSINMAPYTDALGVTRTFDADASVGRLVSLRDHKREKIRVWTELPDNLTDKYRLMHQPAAGVFPGFGAVTTPTTQGDGPWGGNKVSDMTIQYVQKDKLPKHLPENKWSENTGRNNNHGVYAGTAFWNLDVLQGGLNHNSVSAKDGKDVPAAGLKVVGSYLTDEAVQKIEAYAKDNFAGKKLRSRNKREWTPADEEGLQRWINEQVAADPEGWIAETAYTTTAADGTFKLYWKGLYGNNHTGTGGGINPREDKLHKLAGSWDEGSWLNGNRSSKHVNMDWSYVSIYDAKGNELPDNIGVMYPWSLGRWMGPNFGANWGGGDAQFFGGDGAKILHGDDVYAGWNFALAPQALKFDVVEKNTYDNWARVGETVKTDTSGLPITDDLSYYIEWVDKDGNVVADCKPQKADSATTIPSCDLKVPADAHTGDTFTARLKITDGDQDSKNDLILAQDSFAVAREYLAYEEKPAEEGKPATSDPIFDNPGTEDKEEKPEKAKFELGELPLGVTENEVKVDPETGVVTFTPTAAQAGKTYKIPVVMRNEELQVPVLDENGDPVKGDDGNPKTQGRIVARGEATFTVGGNVAPTTVDGSNVKPVDPTDEEQGTGIIVKNPDGDTKVFATDEDGKNVDVVIDPETGEVKVTPGTDVDGPITVTIEDPDLPEGKVEVEVPVNGHEKGRDDNGDGNPIGDISVDETGKQPVKPTDDEQDTGVKVNNPGPNTQVSATDEDGKNIPVEIDENGNIVVTPGTDVDGPITVTVDDPRLDKPVEVDVEVEGHKKGQDDNNSDTTGKISIDESGKQPVKPTDEKQDTGIEVINPSDDTKVTAKDEDGNNVPVEIDENGKIVVTPGENVDGPITVTVTDPNLPGGEQDVEVEVEGHEKGKDDNNSDFTVDESGKQPVKPTDDEQNSGVKVNNPGDDTKITAKDEDGNDVPVRIDEDGNILVTPGENVDGPITVTIEDPRLDKPVEVEVEVEGHEKGKDDNGDGKPNDGKTTVDDSNVKTVEPEGDNQDTGIKVGNKDDDTKISAKDEDGNPVFVEIKEDGSVVVSPEKDAEGNPRVDENGDPIKVDGPITVTITDPDLPEGKVEVEVPVNGHEKGKDDNGDGKPNDGKTTIDNSGQKPVEPKDEKQGTGIIVKNPGDDTKVTAKDEEGNDIPVVINPETGEIEVTPGTDVKGNITVTVEDSDLPGGKQDFTVKVKGPKKGCTESLVGFGVPLLALIPLGIATQVAIPGLQGFKAQVDQQIRDMNTALQNQLGILDPNMARAAAEFDARVKAAGANLGQVLGGLAVLAYGIAAVSTIIAKCGPGNKEYRDTKVDVSSIFGGSSIKQDKDDKGSSVEKKDLSSTPKDEDAKVDETKDEEKADEVEAPETPVVDEDETATE